MKSRKILLIDDEEATLFGYSVYLKGKGFETRQALSLTKAKQYIANEQFDLVLLDLQLPDGNAIEWIPELCAKNESTVVIVVTGVSDLQTAVNAIKLGAQNYLTKPISMEDLCLVMEKDLKISELRKRESLFKRTFLNSAGAFLGTGTASQEVAHFAEIAAMNDSCILLLGETGTGKGVLARWIHENSSRKEQTFVELNCSMLKGELLRSELYGHVRGAFTSAMQDREGLIEFADGGTLFLDEIGDMDLSVQAELLKTLEEKSFRRIGDNKVRKSDFRLICATNRDLAQDTKNGTFRSDLYYRICVFPIQLPPLRKRRDDMPALVEHLLKEFGYSHFPVDSKVIQLLSSYNWPGNIREIKNMLERALLLSQGEPITVDHFPGIDISKEDLEMVTETWDLDQLEMYHIKKALTHFEGDKTKVAQALGISLTSLYRKIELTKKTVPA